MRLSNPFITVRPIKEYEPAQESRSASSADKRIWPSYVAERKTESSYAVAMHDKSMLLRPLNDEHLIEVYLEAKAMNLSNEFIQLIEDALRTRNIDVSGLTNA